MLLAGIRRKSPDASVANDTKADASGPRDGNPWWQGGKRTAPDPFKLKKNHFTNLMEHHLTGSF
jgi:hypothetical protein